MRLRTTGAERRIRWPAVPLAVLAAVAVSWLLFEGSGLVDVEGVVVRTADENKAGAAGVIFVLLVVDVFVPIPSTPLLILAGTILGAPGGVVLGVAGSMASSASAYAVGRCVGPRVLRKMIGVSELGEMQRWGSRPGRWVYVAARAIPMMGETAGICAGAGRVRFELFLGYTLVGTLPVCLLYAVAGSYAHTVEDVALIAALGFLATVAVGWRLRRFARRRSANGVR